MKKIVGLLICIGIFNSSSFAEEDSVIEDLLRSPDIHKERKESLSAKKRVQFFAKGIGFLGLWGLSAAMINTLLTRVSGYYRDIKFENGEYKEKIELAKQLDIGLSQDEKDKYWWEAFTANRDRYIRCGIHLAIAGMIVYYNLKSRVQGKTYRYLRKSFE